MRTRSRNDLGRRGLVLLTVLAAASSAAFGHARPSVVVSIHPLYDLVRQVAGEDADVVRILPVGASPHVFDPTPRDVLRLARADSDDEARELALRLASRAQPA